MRFMDALRAQYYINQLQHELNKIIELYNLSIIQYSLQDVLRSFIEALALEVDQIILPTIAYELANAKSNSLLIGHTPKERYDSFFIQRGCFTAKARELITEYSFLFDLIDQLIRCSFSNLSDSLNHLFQDLTTLVEKQFLKSPHAKLLSITPISGSDRHRNKQTLLFEFSDTTKLIYKPTDLRPDFLFKEFVDYLELPKPYDLKCMRTLPRKKYGWIEFILHRPCECNEEIENYFIRAGVLLAIADALNYTDGHCENLIAHGSYPVLLDGETFFQNYAMPVLEQKSILSTLLIQKAERQSSQQVPYSAFQSPSIERLEALYAYPINDHTDSLEVRFRGISHKKNQNCPTLRGEFFTACQYSGKMIEGYMWAYDYISYRSQDILQQVDWWNEVSCVNSRSVIRETAAYAYLLRRIQQPDICKSTTDAKFFIDNKLTHSPYLFYERADLLTGNIPYFYHIPGKKHFYNGNNFCYENSFDECAIDSIRKEFINRCESKKITDCKIIKKHLNRTYV